MNKIVTIFILLLIDTAMLIGQQIASQSYEGRSSGLILKGEGKTIKNVTMVLVKLPANKISKKLKANNCEYLIISKKGVNTILSDQITASLTAGSVAMIVDGDKFKINNQTAEDSWYYIMKYERKDLTKGSDTSRSLVRIWEETRFNAHQRGGVRPFFNKQSSHTTRFEMHVTTLKAGLMSHDPHTHAAEEIILVMDGETEMRVGDIMYKASNGDLYFLGSNVLHGIKNIGIKPSTYFAYQWN